MLPVEAHDYDYPARSIVRQIIKYTRSRLLFRVVTHIEFLENGIILRKNETVSTTETENVEIAIRKCIVTNVWRMSALSRQKQQKMCKISNMTSRELYKWEMIFDKCWRHDSTRILLLLLLLLLLYTEQTAPAGTYRYGSAGND